MSEININGSIGYTYLKKNNIKVLVLADMHSELPYCKNDSIFVSDWMKKKKSKILLEEVPRLGSTLKELWPGSPHTQKLKQVYLESKVIDGVDVRPFLIPFSWELLLDGEKNNSTLFDYMILIDSFFKMQHKFFIKNLGSIYTEGYLRNSELGNHFLSIKKKTQKLMKDNITLINKQMKHLTEINLDFLEQINELISFIMEWYIIAKIYKGVEEKQNNFIVHAGLAHTSNVISLLKDNYKYEIIQIEGINNYEKQRNNEADGCLKLPTKINDLFGGGY